jgi:hypothetical protein
LFSRVARAFDIVRVQTDPGLKKLPFVWYNPTGPNAYDYYALSSALRRGILWGLDVSFPNLSVSPAAIPPDGMILILTDNKELPSAAEGTLRRIGLTGKLVSQVKIADDQVSYWMTFLQVSRAESTLAAQR